MIRLLLVDDEAPARRRLRRLLASLPDVAVAGEAANGPDAVRLIRESPSDAVLLDVRMPGKDLPFDLRNLLPAPLDLTLEHALVRRGPHRSCVHPLRASLPYR
ncbi:response regulator [Acidobacteria bacterium ACD]|nr:response regulator [Acidobacteria bacterium ACD]